MIIVVEGPDGAGKTSLIERYWPNSRVHNGPPDTEPLFVRFTRQLDEAAIKSQSGELVVFDRFHISEQVYGPLHRGFDALGVEGFEALDNRLVELEALLVFCDPGMDTVLRNWQRNRPTQMVQSLSVMQAIYMAYQPAIRRSLLQMIRYDYRNHFANPVPV